MNTTPSSMNAATLTEVMLPGIVEPDGLTLHERSLPIPAAGEALVEIEATGVSFAEQQMRRGKYYDQPPFPFVPGYDLVGRVIATGPGGPESLIGERFAAITKTGAWATHALVEIDDLIPVPAGIDPADAETMVVNGITAWKMLHRVARVNAGATVLVLGANGGVGSTLVQLAVAAGVRVIGTASARNIDAIRRLGALPIDYRDDVPARVRELAPGGADAVFDHIGGNGIVDSFKLLAKGGTLVSYGSASTRDISGSSRLPVLKLLARLTWWNLLPNGRKATFFNIWAGQRNKPAFRKQLREDLSAVFELLANGRIKPQVAARIPLDRVSDAIRLAESKTVVGKVVLLPKEQRVGAAS